MFLKFRGIGDKTATPSNLSRGTLLLSSNSVSSNSASEFSSRDPRTREHEYIIERFRGRRFRALSMLSRMFALAANSHVLPLNLLHAQPPTTPFRIGRSFADLSATNDISRIYNSAIDYSLSPSPSFVFL